MIRLIHWSPEPTTLTGSTTANEATDVDWLADLIAQNSRELLRLTGRISQVSSCAVFVQRRRQPHPKSENIALPESHESADFRSLTLDNSELYRHQDLGRGMQSCAPGRKGIVTEAGCINRLNQDAGEVGREEINMGSVYRSFGEYLCYCRHFGALRQSEESFQT
jgi:hypothetical protein